MTTLQAEVQRAIDEGISQKEFIRTLTPRLQKLGWWGKQIVVDSDGNAEEVQLGSPRRLALIYNVNTRVAYNAGRYTQMMNNTDTHPFWQYVAVMDSRTRPSHSALNGLVFRYDDPFWKTHYHCLRPVWMQWGYPFHPVRIISPPAMLRLAWINRPEKSEKCR